MREGLICKTATATTEESLKQAGCLLSRSRTACVLYQPEPEPEEAIATTTVRSTSYDHPRDLLEGQRRPV